MTIRSIAPSTSKNRLIKTGDHDQVRIKESIALLFLISVSCRVGFKAAVSFRDCATSPSVMDLVFGAGRSNPGSDFPRWAT